MAKTFFRHMGCGGNIVAVFPEWIISTPFMIINMSKISISKVELVRTGDNTGSIVPTYKCIKCLKKFSRDEVLDELQCDCTICGDEVRIRDAKVTSISPCICSKCLVAIRSGKVAAISEVLNRTTKFGEKDMIEIMFEPIKVK